MTVPGIPSSHTRLKLWAHFRRRKRVYLSYPAPESPMRKAKRGLSMLIHRRPPPRRGGTASAPPVRGFQGAGSPFVQDKPIGTPVGAGANTAVC